MSEHSERIIAHMNKDHQLSLGDYLVVYGRVNPKQFVDSSVEITELDETRFTLNYKTPSLEDRYFTLKWADAVEDKDIQVKGFGDLKEKLVAMANYTAEVQGFANKRVTLVLGPEDGSAIMYVIFAFLSLNAYNPSIIRNLVLKDRTFLLLSKYIPYRFPKILATAYKLYESNAIYLFAIIYSIHLVEIAFFDLPYFKKYRVPVANRLKWAAMHFVEGFFVIWRLKSLR